MMYSTASLQDLCLREVINNLEYYPPELLACLPPTLRRPLLVDMPIVDLCQLENTCVFDGVDAEMVWKERYEHQTLKYISVIPNEYSASNCGVTLDHLCMVTEPELLLDRYETMREKYFAIIAYSIFEFARPTGYYRCDSHPSGIATFVADIDFKKYDLLDQPVDVVNYLGATVKIDQAHMTREPSDESYSNADNLRLDNHVTDYELYKCEPEIQPLNHRTYMHVSKLYQEVPPHYSSFLNEENHCRLSEEDALMLLMDKCDYYAGDLYINVVRCGAIRWNWKDDAIKSLIGRFFSKIFKLELGCYSDDNETEEALKDITEAIFSSSSHHLFSLTILEGYDNHINAIAPLLSNPSVPCKLNELRLDSVSLDDLQSADLLGDILSTQTNISSLDVCYLDTTISDSRMLASIYDILQRPDFKHLSLIDVNLSCETVQTLTIAFLTTPCSQPQGLQLRIKTLTGSLSEQNQKLGIPQSALEYKSLEFYTHTPHDVSSWLLSLQPLRLMSLCVYDVNCSTLALAAHHTSLYVSQLDLEITDFSTKNFLTLLQNQSLKELQFVPNGTVGLCDITRGLLKIGETQTLETLTVNSFHYSSPCHMFGSVKTSSRAEVEEFGEVLFSLPHLNHFSLELSIELDQDLPTTTDFVETLFKSLEKVKKPRLKRFVLNFFSVRFQLPLPVHVLEQNLQATKEEIGMEVNMTTYIRSKNHRLQPLNPLLF